MQKTIVLVFLAMVATAGNAFAAGKKPCVPGIFPDKRTGGVSVRNCPPEAPAAARPSPAAAPAAVKQEAKKEEPKKEAEVKTEAKSVQNSWIGRLELYGLSGGYAKQSDKDPYKELSLAGQLAYKVTDAVAIGLRQEMAYSPFACADVQTAVRRSLNHSCGRTLAGLAFATEPIEVGAYAGLGYGKELKSLFAYRAYAAYAKKTGLYAKAGVDGVGSQLTLYARPGYNFGLVGVNGLYEQTSFKLDGSRRYIDRYGVEVPLFLTEKLTLTPQVSYGNDLHRIGFGGLISVGF